MVNENGNSSDLNVTPVTPDNKTIKTSRITGG